MRNFKRFKAALLIIAAFFLFTSAAVYLRAVDWFTTGTHFTFTYYDKDGNYVADASVRVDSVFNGHDTVFSKSNVIWSSDTGANVMGLGFFRFAKDSVSFIAYLDNLVPPKIRYDATSNVLISGPPLRYPLRPEKNTPLPGTHGTMKFIRPAGNTTVLYEISNRMVEGPDTISTKAGTFPCWIITATEQVKPVTFKAAAKVRERKVKEWYSPVWGVVKAEYSVDGVLDQVRALTGME